MSDEILATTAKALAKDMAEAGEEASGSAAGFAEKTAENAEQAGKNLTEASSTETENAKKLLDLIQHPERAPKALEAGNPARSPGQVRNIKNRLNRWREAENNARQRWRGDPETPFTVPNEAADPAFPLTKDTVRKVDCPVRMPNGDIVAVEVKMYNRFRRVEIAPGQYVNEAVEVPLSDKIKQQIAKDVALRRTHPGYDPRWEFIGAGPSPALRDELKRAGIIIIEFH